MQSVLKLSHWWEKQTKDGLSLTFGHDSTVLLVTG
jgi:hypothetical protein